MAPPTPPTPAAPGLPPNYDPNMGVIAPGLVEAGNLELNNRPLVQNDDGTHSSEYSVSFGTDKGEVLVPTVVGGRFLTPDGKKPKVGSPADKDMQKAAQEHYNRTGEHMGIFDTPENADVYANAVHNRRLRPGLTPTDIQGAGGKTVSPPTISAPPKSSMADSANEMTRELGEAAEKPWRIPGNAQAALYKSTEPIENYTESGRAAHPILSRVGDVTRGAKELLSGTQAGGKPEGTKAGALDEAMVLSTATDAAKFGASAEELTAKYGSKIANAAMDTARTFAESAKEDFHAYRNARSPEGSTEAGGIKFEKTGKNRPVFKYTKTPEGGIKIEHTGETREAHRTISTPGLDEEDIKNAGGTTVKPPTPRTAEHPTVTMTPQEFLDHTSADESHVYPDTVAHYQIKLQHGEPLEPLEIHHDADGNVVGGNGRHRATAMLNEKVPSTDVRVIKTVPTPEEARLDMGNMDEPKGNADVAASAQRYNADLKRPPINHEPTPLPDVAKKNRLADAYDEVKHDPNNPAVKKAYGAFKKETAAQFDHMRNDLGIKVDFTPNDPYKNADEMQADVRDNKHLSVYTGGDLPPDHPMAEKDALTGQTYNNMFRATHDVFGHAAGGFDFSEGGEHSAYGAHQQMYSPEAQKAMRTETQGQSNWFFNNKGVREGAEPGAFPQQKAAILPEKGEVPAAPDYKAIGEKSGVEFRGVQKGVEGAHPGLAIYQDPKSGTSVAVRLDEFSPEKLQEHVDNARTRMAGTPAVPAKTGDLFDKAAEHYGTTNDINKAGYVGADGRMLDFSQGRGARMLDHGDISSIEGVQSAHNSNPRNDFADKTGAARFVNDVKNNHLGVQFSVNHPPTPEQLDRFAPLLEGGKNVEIEFMDGDKFVGSSGINEVHDTEGLSRTVRDAQADVNKRASKKDWTDVAAKAAKKNSAGGIDPRTGLSDEKGIGTEIYPEARQALDHKPTKEDFESFENKNRDILSKHPELRVGWDNESNLEGGHELNIGAVGKGAKRVAKKLEQRAAFDIGKGEAIPTGGTGLRSQFANYPMEHRLADLRGEPLSDIKGFEHLSPEVHGDLEPDEAKYLEGDKTLQRNVMNHYHSVEPSINETTNAMQAGSALGGWWQRYIDIFHGMMEPDVKEAANAIGPTHAEALKQWHAAVSGNKSVQDANNLAWHSYADWLDAGKPTDRKSIDNIVRANGAQPEGSLKKGNAAISDTLYRGSKRIKFKGLDTNKLFALVNSPEMKGERPFANAAFDEKNPNPLVGKSEGARKIPSMGATVAGKGNLNRLVIDAHIRDFYGHKSSGGPAAQYIADSVHLRQAAKALGLQGGEGQEQLWGTVLGLKELLKTGLTNAGAAARMSPEVINKIGKDYAEVIANDPEITKPGGVLDRLKERHGAWKGSAGFGEAYSRAQGPGPTNGSSGPAGSQASVSKTGLEKTAARLREAISPKKIKKLQEDGGGGIKGWQQTLFGKDEPVEPETKEREPGEEE